LKNTLIISDLHFPYTHRDWLPFLTAIKDVYGIEEAKQTGDLTDNHFSSYHEFENGALSGVEELQQSKRMIKQLEELFPKLVVVEGNHDSLTKRKAKTAGIPEEHIRHPNDIYDVNWDWKERDFFKIDNDTMCLLSHSLSASTVNNAKQFSHCSIQGHHHSSFGLEYFADSSKLRWAMTAGCLIDDHAPVFRYNKRTVLKRPIIGSAVIVDDYPIMVPMKLDKNGRWLKRI